MRERDGEKKLNLQQNRAPLRSTRARGGKRKKGVIHK